MFGFLTSLPPSVRAPLAVCLGAIPGALSRYYITVLAAKWLGITFPYGTFFVNLSGALIMGFFTTLTFERLFSQPDLRILIAVGFLGSYTTFSSYALDTANLLRTGRYSITVFYGVGSAVLGFLCLELGSFLARRLP